MNVRRSGIVWLALMLAFAGLVVPYWPLGALSILIAASAGSWSVAISIGILCDILFSTPGGMFHWVLMPFTFGAIALLGIRWIFGKYFSLR